MNAGGVANSDGRWDSLKKWEGNGETTIRESQIEIEGRFFLTHGKSKTKHL